jgi:hypothetical protein
MSLTQFLNDCCELRDGSFVGTGDLWRAYLIYEQENDLPKLPGGFHAAMRARGYVENRSRRVNGKQLRTYEGVALRPELTRKAPRRDPLAPLLSFAGNAPASHVGGKEITAHGPGSERDFFGARVCREEAASLLARSSYNRDLRRARLAEFRDLMNAGKWDPFVAEIDFDWNGNLINGHHTLNALLLSRLEHIDVKVTFGNDPKSYIHIDRNSSKSIKDVLGERKYGHAAVLGGVGRVLHAWDVGLLARLYEGEVRIDDAMAAIERHPGIVDYLTVPDFMRAKPFPKPVYRALRYIICSANPSAGPRFFNELAEGLGATLDAPPRRLREQINNQDRRIRLGNPEAAAWILVAWNAFAEGRSLQRIRFERRQKFPALVTESAVLESKTPIGVTKT